MQLSLQYSPHASLGGGQSFVKGGECPPPPPPPPNALLVCLMHLHNGAYAGWGIINEIKGGGLFLL